VGVGYFRVIERIDRRANLVAVSHGYVVMYYN
jgi:hypothetical protein